MTLETVVQGSIISFLSTVTNFFRNLVFQLSNAECSTYWGVPLLHYHTAPNRTVMFGYSIYISIYLSIYLYNRYLLVIFYLLKMSSIKNAFILRIFIILIPLKHNQLRNNKHYGLYPTKATHMLRQNGIHKLN